MIEKAWKKGTKSVDVVYPNKYFGGVYSLGLLILYNLINGLDGWICNRVFLDKGKITSKLIGFTLQYEPDYYNLIKILKKNNIPLDKDKREQIIFAGGPCINANQHTLSGLIDFFVIGESEEVTPKILKAYEEVSGEKKAFLQEISKLVGVFVPGISTQITTAFIEDIDQAPYPLYQPLPETIDKTFVFGEAFILEIERGCPFNCKFCLLPTFYTKVRFRSLEKIKEIIDAGIKLNKRKKVVIYSASFSHPKRKEILKYLISKGMHFSVPSLKAELIDEELLNLIKMGGQRSLTVAPESNQRLRIELGKNLTDQQIFAFLKNAKKAGFEEVKTYFMVALPGETKKDLDETVELIKNCKSFFQKIYVSINPLTPKPRSVFSEYKFDKKTAK
ncbi:radical SAM protein, partial [Candidatus Woesearchaeota archaeon]|nr:radical SAM protein [Candidatus Woesearchaeota archaeon]